MQNQLSLVPQGATELSGRLAVVQGPERVVFYHSSEPIFSYRVGDRVGKRVAEGMLSDLGLAGPTALAAGLGVNKSTVHRNREKYRAGGIDALTEPDRIKTPHKLTAECLARAQEQLDKGQSRRSTAGVVGVSPGAIDYAVNDGRLKERARRNARRPRKELVGPRRRSDEAVASPAGIAVARHEERMLASVGKLEEARPVFRPAEAVKGAGVLIALPTLLEVGLLVVGQQVYRKVKDGFFGLQSVLLVMSFCALLRIKTVEQLSKQAPGELGCALGLDRAPEVKTLRRKLKELGLRKLARKFAAKLAERWAKKEPESLGFLLVDGHVRVYHGRKHSLPKKFVQQRRMCMPATTDTWVNDAEAEPLFFVTSSINEGLLAVMDGKVLPEVRRIVGANRRVTFVFDREGWSPEMFMRWSGIGFDVLTYRKGAYEAWPEDCFTEVEVEVSGEMVKYRLGERSIRLLDETRSKKGDVVTPAFWAREIRRLCDSGHQTSVVTTRQDLHLTTIALRMFSRWTQENFFRYMRQEFSLDHLSTYAVEPADPDRLVPNPALKQKQDALRKLRRELADAEQNYGRAAMANPEGQQPNIPGVNAPQSKLELKIRSLREQCNTLQMEAKALPKKVLLKEIKDEKTIVKLEEDRKVLTDSIRMIAYRAETSLFNVIKHFLTRGEDEGRAFLKSVFSATADLIPDEEAGTLTVAFHSLANPRSNAALRTLCELSTQQNALYPGTRLRLVYQAP